MRRSHSALLLLLLLTGAVWAQGKGPSMFLTSGSRTDTPAKPGQASDEATAAAHYLEDRIAIEIQNQYPCANVTEDRDVAAILKWEHDHSLLDSNYQADLSGVAGSLGARYLLSATVTQAGGQIYMQASCMDTSTARSVEKADKQTSSQNAANSAESLARGFVGALGPLFAVKPESGKTYPVGTVFSAVHQRSFRGHAHFKSTWTEVLAWLQNLGTFEKPKRGEGDPTLHCGPDNYGACGGCSDCTCAGNCMVQINSPGRYRLVNVTESLDSPELKVEFVSEVTIAGSCRK